VNRRAVHGPYFFEVFTVINFVIIALLLMRITPAPVRTMPSILMSLIPAFVLQTAAGVGLRALVAWRQGRGRDYGAILRSPAWLIDTARIIVFSALSVHTYSWIKLSMPLLHARLFDQELWDIDRAIFFGHSPNIFFLDLFSNRAMLRLIDVSYGNVFLASLIIASAFFGSAPSRRVRVAFTDSNTAMWIVGAWLYMLVPSLGPAYRFPDVWLALASVLAHTQELQRILMTNYQAVLQFRRGVNAPVSIFYGVAAFPSLHVAFEMLVVLWMRRVWRPGEVLFWIFFLIIFLGSVITGWHYLIDSLAGIVLAWVCYAVAARAWRIDRWVAIRDRR
jgi:hypothetical protein